MSSRAISSAKNRRTTTIGTTNDKNSSSVTNGNQPNQTTANKELTVKEAFALMNSRISNLENQSKVNTPNDLSFMENYVKKESYDSLLDSLKKQFTDVNAKIKNFDNQPVQLEKTDTSEEFALLKENNNSLNKKLDNFTKMFNMKFDSLNTLNTANSTNENSDLKNELSSLKEFTNTIFNLQNKLHENLVSLQSDIIKMNIHIHEKLSILETDNTEEEDSIIITDNINIIEDVDLPLDIEGNENIEKNLQNMMNAMIGQMENRVEELMQMKEEGKLEELEELEEVEGLETNNELEELEEVEGLETNNELDEAEKLQQLSKEELEHYVKSYEENIVQAENEEHEGLIEVIEPAVEPIVEPIENNNYNDDMPPPPPIE